jgi:hypothetical protein
MQELVKLQVEAVKGIRIDKVTVWDGGESRDGKNRHGGLHIRPYQEHTAAQRNVFHGGHEPPGLHGHRKGGRAEAEAAT